MPVSLKMDADVSFTDIIFTSVSLSCGIGLTTVSIADTFSLFGKIISAVLFQIGSLGVVTMMSFGAIILHRQLSLRESLTVQSAFNLDPVGGMTRFVKRVVMTTLCIEGCGALLLLPGFMAAGYDFLTALGYGAYHSISSFCGAGFVLFGNDSYAPFRTSVLTSVPTIIIIFLGGLGFPVIRDLYTHARARFRREKTAKGGTRRKFALNSKLVLSVTLFLLALGTVLFALFEWDNPATLGAMPIAERIFTSFFHSLTHSSAGFTAIPQSGLNDITKLFLCVIMLIGGSPAGTAGGIKTVTIAVIAASIFSAIKGRKNTAAFGRTIPADLLQKALTVTMMMLTVSCVMSAAIFLTDGDIRYTDLMFEVCSALGNVGATTGVPSDLSGAGKVILMLCMYIGRVGPITVVFSLNVRARETDNAVKYPDERVIIG